MSGDLGLLFLPLYLLKRWFAADYKMGMTVGALSVPGLSLANVWGGQWGIIHVPLCSSGPSSATDSMWAKPPGSQWGSRHTESVVVEAELSCVMGV